MLPTAHEVPVPQSGAWEEEEVLSHATERSGAAFECGHFCPMDEQIEEIQKNAFHKTIPRLFLRIQASLTLAFLFPLLMHSLISNILFYF